MSFRPNLAPSALLKLSDEDESQKLTKGDFKKMKELEEARKSAQLPAMKDERGKDINPHIPQYIMSAPWYFNAVTPTLRHQRKEGFDDEESSASIFGKAREIKKQQIITKYRKGACENCGAMDHKRRDCLEKPRQRLAKYTYEPIKVIDIKVNNDESNEKLSYDAKRDRYNNYDSSNFNSVIEKYSDREELLRQNKSKELEEHLSSIGDESARKAVFDSVAEVDESRTGEDVAMPGQKFDAKQRQSIRNLRLRENVPKYLLNLDPDSAFYDPKSRSMRGNPFEHTGKSVDEVPFAGDNYVRYEEDAQNMLRSQVFAWEMGQRGVDIHLQADPTRVALLEKETREKTSEKKHHIQKEILQEYGGEEYLEPPPAELIYGESSSYFEYDTSGKVIKGPEKPIIRSIYEEDVMNLNHTTVWGSFWFEGKWGYKCCKQLLKNCYCVSEDKINKTTKRKMEDTKISEVSETKRIYDDMKPPAEPINHKSGQLPPRKKYNSNYDEVKAPTEKEMEAYREERLSQLDPMAKFMKK